MQGVNEALNAYKTRNRYRVRASVLPSGRVIDNNVGLTDREIEEILTMPKVGTRLTFCQACDLRNAETVVTKPDGDFDFNLAPLEISLAEWARRRGCYIEFDESELEAW